MGTLWTPLKTQLRVIGALTLREILTRYGRHNIGFLWLFVEPMLFTLGVAALWTISGFHRQSSIPIVAFAVTGYSAVLLWRNMPARCVGAVEPNLALLYHRQVKILDVFLARLLLEAAGATISFIALSLVFVSVGWMRAPEDLLKVALGWLMLAWFGTSLALLLGSLSARTEIVEKLWHPASYVLFPLSGAAFMVDALPKQAQEAVLWLPMVHGVELLRDGYFGAAVRTHYSVSYIATVCLVLTALGLAQQRLVSRHVVPQ
jgi:capsular polysaccharide transport system permease protein